MTEQIKIDFDNAPHPPLRLRGGAESGGVTDAETRVLTLIQRGRDNAISMPTLAAAAGISTRDLQTIVKGLIENHGILIASSCGKNNGYYFPESPAELAAAKAQIIHRIISLAKRLRAMDRAAYEAIFGQEKLIEEAEK